VLFSSRLVLDLDDAVIEFPRKDSVNPFVVTPSGVSRDLAGVVFPARRPYGRTTNGFTECLRSLPSNRVEMPVSSRILVKFGNCVERRI
jgi:hypothetical protein